MYETENEFSALVWRSIFYMYVIDIGWIKIVLLSTESRHMNEQCMDENKEIVYLSCNDEPTHWYKQAMNR